MASRSIAGLTAALVSFGIAVHASAALAQPAARGSAEGYPSQNVVLVVPYPAGGPADVMGRIIIPYLGEELGKPVIIENRAGASGTLGAASVARATPDGHTLLLCDVSMTVAPSVVARTNFDPRKDFAAVAPLMRSLMMLVVNPRLPSTVSALVAEAKAHPGAITYGHSGLGSPPHLGALALTQATGIDLAPVPYRGVALALSDVIGGHIDLVFVSQGVAAAQITGGKARVLATMGPNRLRAHPDVPTFRENAIDLKVIDEGTWFGVVAPAGTPAPIVARLNQAINKVLADPAARGRLEAIDYVVTGGTAAQLAELIEQHTGYWHAAFEQAGVKPQ